jgi:ABC-2 type transport system permease protein
MSVTTLDPPMIDDTVAPARPDSPPEPGAAHRCTEWLRDVAVLTRRNLLHVRREPAQMSDATVQPLLFTVLFVYIFGAAMVLPGGGSYKDFAIGGLVTMNLSTATMGTAVGLSSDLATGVINRFRTLPMARSAILAGRTLSDLVASVLCGSIVVLTGFVIGWRPDHGVLGVVAGLGVAVTFAYGLSWFTAWLGLMVSDPESAQAVGLVILFPLAFVSSCFVPTQGLPHVLRVIADWNPVSAVAGACRELFGNPNPAGLTESFPAQHPVLVALLWSAAIIAICAPLASRLLQKRTTD